MRSLAELVAVRQDQIVDRWEARAQATLASCGRTRAELVGWLPEFLDLLAEGLRANGRGRGRGARSRRAAALAAAHGRQRLRQGVDIVQLVREYGLVRQVVLEVAEEERAPITYAELRALTDRVAEAIAEAVRHHAADREREIAEGALLLRGIADRAPAAIWVKNARGRYVFTNARLEALFGKTRAQLLGRNDAELGVPEPLASLLADADRRALAGEQVTDEEVLPTPEGDRVFVVHRFRLAGSKRRRARVGGIAFDITRRKWAEDAVERARAFERQLIGVVSHDLRNPLAAISLAAAVLRRHRSLDARESSLVGRIAASAARAERLTRDLLDFTQARIGGGIPVQRRPADAGRIVRAAAQEAAAARPETEVRVSTAGDLRGEWDPGRLAQLVGNLVTNALKYGAEGEPVLVSVRGEGGEVRIAVANVGEPIAPEELPRLFEPLRRGRSAAGDPTRSLGLGLFIVDAIARAHGGGVHVRSSAEEGTIFEVVLPRGDAAARGEAAAYAPVES